MREFLLIASPALIAIFILFILPPPRHRPTIKRKGIEMKARNGRLVHFRETESEHEL